MPMEDGSGTALSVPVTPLATRFISPSKSALVTLPSPLKSPIDVICEPICTCAVWYALKSARAFIIAEKSAAVTWPSRSKSPSCALSKSSVVTLIAGML